jgi:hypothetical protein
MASIYEMMMGANKSFQDGRAQGQQQHLGQLYSQALTAPQDQRTPLLAQMAQVSPDAAVGAQRSLADGDETAIKSTMQALSMATAAWKAGNKDMAQGFYTQAAPHLASLAGGKPLPPQMDDAAAQAFEKILASAQGGQQQLSPHVIGNALVGPDGQVLYQGEQAAKAPAYKEVPDGQGGTILMQFDPQSGGLVPAQIGGDQQPPPDSGVPVQAGAMLDPTKDYPQLASAFPGTQVSSLLRSPQHNAEVGGVPNSQHMRGTAGDFVIPKPEQAAFIAKAKAMGYEVIPEGDHVHVELPPGTQGGVQLRAGCADRLHAPEVRSPTGAGTDALGGRSAADGTACRNGCAAGRLRPHQRHLAATDCHLQARRRCKGAEDRGGARGCAGFGHAGHLRHRLADQKRRLRQPRHVQGRLAGHDPAHRRPRTRAMRWKPSRTRCC